ncbi:MAG TPA: hypothetical protein VEL28_21040 [Candidatus Binatia bacterium]|nr:hypothetical protein [Candidatus Binatia bacterium]
MLAADAQRVFCNTADFGEELTYYPHEGASKTVHAAVTRHPDVAAAGGRHKVNDIEISVATTGDYGVATVVEGRDQVDIVPKLGGAAKRYVVREILQQDAGMWRLLCRGTVQ